MALSWELQRHIDTIFIKAAIPEIRKIARAIGEEQCEACRRQENEIPPAQIPPEDHTCGDSEEKWVIDNIHLVAPRLDTGEKRRRIAKRMREIILEDGFQDLYSGVEILGFFASNDVDGDPFERISCDMIRRTELMQATLETIRGESGFDVADIYYLEDEWRMEEERNEEDNDDDDNEKEEKENTDKNKPGVTVIDIATPTPPKRKGDGDEDDDQLARKIQKVAPFAVRR